MRRRSQSATLTNFSLVSELGESWQEDAWSVSVSCPEVQNSQCGCYYSKNTGSYGCYNNCSNVTKSAQRLAVCTCEDKCLGDCAGQTAFKNDQQVQQQSILVASSLLFSSIYLNFYSSPLCQVNPSIFRFLCLSPCLSPSTPHPPACSTAVRSDWMKACLEPL